MLEGLRERAVMNERFFLLIVSFVLIAVIFFNLSTLRSVFVGIFALSFYLFLNGRMLGRTFFGDEDWLSKLGFGLFLFISLMALMGIFVQIISEHEFWYLLGMLSATIATVILSYLFGSEGSTKGLSENKVSFFGRVHTFFKGRYIFPVYVSYVVFFVLSLFLLLDVRSGWIRGPIWKVIPPIFLQVYFVATVILGAIVLLPGKTMPKLLCIISHSIFSLSFVIIILYPGILYYDPWYTLARSQESTMLIVVRIFRQTVSVRDLNTLLKGRICFALIATFAETLCVDRYWTTVLLVPVLWGFFAPLALYKITQKISGSKDTSILAAFLTIPNLYFLAWGKLTAAASMGILFFIPFVYFLLQFLSCDEASSIRWFFSSRGIKTYFPALITFASLVAIHFLPMALTISFAVLAFALKQQKTLQVRFFGNLSLFTSIVLSTLVLPLAVIGRGILIPALGTAGFNIEKVLDTSVWMLVFGVSEELPFQDALLYHIFPLLGLIGFAYALQRKKVFNKTLCLFLFLAFGVCLLDYRILEYAVSGERIFGPGRVKVFRDIVAIPFASIVIMISAKSLYGSASKIKSQFRWRNIFAGALVCVSLSAWVVAAVYETYEFYTNGLLATSLEVDAVKYIDEHTNGSYVVLAPHPTAAIGHGFMGYPNYEKMYYSMGKLGAPYEPSVAGMYELMRTTEADVGYYMVSFRASPFDELIAEASRIFGLFKILANENGQIYIFNYKIPPLPQNPDVVAFHWDAPPAYYVQNDLVRVLINPTTGTVDIVDFWGDLYEGIDLDKTLIDGNPIGNLSSVEFYDFQSDKWIEWDPDQETPPAEQFRFKLGFEEDSLIGSLKSGESFIDLHWESGRESALNIETGDFTRLYMPGLVGGEDSYDINSREYGFLYTTAHGDNITLQPAYSSNMTSPTLKYGQIKEHCGFTLTDSHMFYDLYVHNNADMDQWVYIEVWLPNEVYTGTFPPFYYSLDSGETWIFPRHNVETGSVEPVRTTGGAEVNWIVSVPRNPKEIPTQWWTYKDATGGIPVLPENFTDSGGAQNRMFFGFYLPTGDSVLLRLGAAIYYVRPLKVSYVFKESDNIYYGLNNMEMNLIKFYNLHTSSYVGGLKSTQVPLLLSITQGEDDKLDSVSVTLPSNSAFSLLSWVGVDTMIDLNADGIPDLILED